MPMTRASTPPVHRAYTLREVKAVDEARGTFSGYLAVFRNEDHGGDICEPGCFAKTIAEAKARQFKRQAINAPSGRYLWPIFWGHDDTEPVGGFTLAREDEYGLYVEAELDLDIDQGRRAYSGMLKGYVPNMSIGYFTVKATYDRAGVRHLKELSVFEGSIVPVGMNEEALILEVKSASGKASWPLGDRTRAWDGAAAHKRIVAWATGTDGTVDAGKLKSVHFWSPAGDADENVSQYKLLFCDVADGGKVEAMPKGIFACAGSHGVEAADIPSEDVAGVKAKIAAYYRRMADEYQDDSIRAPWDAGDNKEMQMEPREVKGTGGAIAVSENGTHAAYTGTHTHAHKAMGSQGGDSQHEHSHTHAGDADHGHSHASEPGKRRRAGTRKALDFAAALQMVSADDTLQDEWGDAFQALVQALYSVMCQGAYLMPGESFDAQDAAETVLQQFSAAMADIVKRSVAAQFCPVLDDDGDSFLDPDGPNASTSTSADSASDSGYMSMDTSEAEAKRGAMMSAANHTALGAMVASAKALHKSLAAFHQKMTPTPKTEPDGEDAGTTQDTSGTNANANQDGKSLAGAGRTSETTQEESGTTPLPTTLDIERIIRAQLAVRDAMRRI